MHHYYLFHSEKKQNNFGTVFELFITFVPIGNTNWVTCVSSWAIFCLGLVYFEIFQEFVQKPLAVLSQSVWDWQDEMSLVKHFKMWKRENLGEEGGGTKLEREKPLLTCSLHIQLPTETTFLLSFSLTGVTNTWDWEQQRKKRRFLSETVEDLTK